MLTKLRRNPLNALVLALIFLVGLVGENAAWSPPSVAYANGFIDFEDGTDGQTIRSTIPGLKFTTTAGYDWVYGDWRTGNYNGKYPDGSYTSNGNFFAWLGPNQGNGRIDFTQGGATYISFGVSSPYVVNLAGYDSSNNVVAQASFTGSNLGTGQTDELRVDAPSGKKFSYAIVSGQANYWCIDDLSTDATGVPNERLPLIFVPGVGGTRLRNPTREVWPNTIPNQLDSSKLLPLRLQTDGIKPWDPNSQDYKITLGDIIRTEVGMDTYQTMLDYLGQRGYKESAKTLYVMPYDWRKDISTLATDLDTLVEKVKRETGKQKVNILAHSMGGLVVRTYISNATRAGKVDTLITLGTPYLGSPKIFQAVHYGACLIENWAVCFPDPQRLKEVTQNFPSVYQTSPSQNYFRIYPHGILNMDRDTNGDGQNEGWLSYSQVNQILSTHNDRLTPQAESVRSIISSYRGGTNGVNVYAFVGYGQGTVGEIREYLKPKWYDPLGWGDKEVAYDITTIDGDNAVPLHSADLGRNMGSNDFSGSVSFYYAKLNHGELASYNGGKTVLRLVADMFEVHGSAAALASAYQASPPSVTSAGDTTHTAPGLLRGVSPASVTASADWLPIDTEPQPLSGRQILMQGEAQIEIRDSLGNWVIVGPGGILASAIPGSSVVTIGDTTSVYLPDGDTYVVRLVGETQAHVDLRFRTIASDVLTQTVLYKDVPMTASATAVLTYSTTTAWDGNLYMDWNGDGTIDETIPPAAYLDSVSSADITPPTITVQVDGTRGPDNRYVGQATITVNAADNPGGSGLRTLEFTVDAGKTVHTYTGPITLDNAETVPQILVRATDTAGNEQLNATFVSPFQVMLPLVIR